MASISPERLALADLLDRLFVPTQLAHAPHLVPHYRASIAWLARALGRTPRVSDLTREGVAAALATAAGLGVVRSRVVMIRKNLGRLWKFALAVGLAIEPYEIVPTPRSAPKRRPEPIAEPAEPEPSLRGRRGHGRRVPDYLPSAIEGTLRHYFEQVYRPQRLVRCAGRHLQGYRMMLRALHAAHGDVRLTDLSGELVTAHMGAALDAGLSPRTINRERGMIFAIWGHAHRAGLAPPLAEVAKLRESQDEPDAWTADELARILASVDKTGYTGDIAGLPFADWWRAALLTGYWTGLRRKTLLGLRRADVDLEAGTIVARGASMKGRRGKMFHVGTDCVAALRRIWLPERELLLPWPWVIEQSGKHFGWILAAAGVDAGTHRLNKFHKLRRTTATLMHKSAGLAAAAELLGHSGQEVIERYIAKGQLDEYNATRHLPTIGGVR